MDNWSYYKRPLTVHELLEEIENLDNDSELPTSVVLFPPINANADNTDEDSGDDETFIMNNLPGNHLNTQVEVVYNQEETHDSSPDDTDTEDKLPLSHFVKTKRIKKKSKKFSWTQQDLSDKDLPSWKNMYGPKNKLSSLELFYHFFDNNLFETLVHYSNLYASQKNRTAESITMDEMKCFVGVLLLSGYNCLPRRSMYWESSSDSGNKLVYSAISRNRFTHIMQNFHCNDNNNLNNDDKFSKIRPLINALNQRFIDFAPVEESHSVDESMVPYFGRHGSKQFIRGKPIRWGYKLWTGTSKQGYIEWFEPYQGSSTKLTDCYRDLGLGASVVLKFSDILISNKGQLPFHLYFDNFFTSLDLLQVLCEKDLKGTGTIRENRLANCTLSHSKAMKKLKRGTFEYALEPTKNILISKWNDNNVVTMASNATSIYPLSNVTRYSQKEKKRITIEQPNIIKKYNQYMGGVDRADQNISLYRISIRGKKWYFPLVSQCIDMAEQNAWQLHRIHDGKMDHLTFRRSIAQALLETHKKTTKRGPVRSSTNLHALSRYDRLDHLVVYQQSQTRCSECHKKVQFRCDKCDVALHPKICFFSYHQKN